MIRPFHLRDLPLIHRLGERGVLLQAEVALTRSPHPVRSALVNMLVGGQYTTYVWKSEETDAAAFVQLRWNEGEPTARLACLGWEASGSNQEEVAAGDEDVWLPLLDQLVAEAGTRGVHNLIAEASETGPELPVLRRAGFAVYTRQDVWINDRASEGGDTTILRLRDAEDDWDINVLYSNIVPHLIQSVEPSPPTNHGQNWVLRESGELSAFIHIHCGPVANWMRLFIHPNAHTKPREIIMAALSASQPSAGRPVYCCVRRYQSWLQDPLEQAGFRLWGSQAVMVKHIVRHVKKRTSVRQGVLEPQTVPGSGRLVQGFSQPSGNGRGQQ